MRAPPLLFLLVLLAFAGWSLVPAAPAAPQSALQLAATATPVFLQQASGTPLLLAPSTGPAQPLGVFGTSVMPPGPNPGELCSTGGAAGTPTDCSVFGTQQRCSAFNDNDNLCSVSLGPNAVNDGICSAFGPGSACSVLPPQMGLFPSFCSTINQSNRVAVCSAVGQSARQLCSTKGAGGSVCSAADTFNISQCSVLNFGTQSRSFCSTKFNQPAVAKSCSAFFPGAECSVAVGAKGVCTTFGAAVVGSCSAFDPQAHCSVIGGPAGTHCAQ